MNPREKFRLVSLAGLVVMGGVIGGKDAKGSDASNCERGAVVLTRGVVVDLCVPNVQIPKSDEGMHRSLSINNTGNFTRYPSKDFLDAINRSDGAPKRKTR